MNSLEIATIAAKAIDSKKAEDIKVIKIEDLTVIADYFVIATGTSTTQVRALSDEVEFKLSEVSIKPIGREGTDTKNWVVLDYNNVIVHIFYPTAREFYDLDRLWADGTQIEIDY